MKTFACTINPGCGDILLVRNEMDTIKDQYDCISISPNKSIVDRCRDIGDGRYYIFCLEFMRMIFHDHPYKIVEDDSLPRFSIIDNDLKGLPITQDGLFKMNDYSDLLCDGKDYIEGDYIIVTTKVRGTPLPDSYHRNYKESLIQTLLSLSKKYKIILMGERTPPQSPENIIWLPGKVYCIYDELISNLFITNNVIDMTVDDIQMAVPDINNLKKDCSIMKKAKAVITLGIGGNMIISTMASTKSINFIEDANYCPYYVGVVNYPQRNGVTITNNFKKFIKECKEI